MATRARGAPPRAVPATSPRNETLWTMLPPAVDEVCVPWPWMSRGERTSWARVSSSRSSAYHRAPMSFRLQLLAGNEGPAWQIPFHLEGGGPYPASEKLGDSGVIPDEINIECRNQLCSNQLKFSSFF